MTTPLFHFNRHRDDIAKEVVERVVEQLGESADDPKRALQLTLNDAAFHEISRLEKAGSRQASRLDDWRSLARRIGTASEAELRDEVQRRTEWYVRDVIGHFDRRVYRFATNVLPVGLSALFNTTDLTQGLSAFKDLSARIRVEGQLETLRSLADKGTLVVVPTHSSNLDSIVLGWSLTHAGLPPVTYGAGKNLFSNKLVGYFMRNLGAYRVDRRLRHRLYKATLKTYSQVLIERGYHSLFFPGGTRGRSGEIEQKLKLGLMGSALAAFSERVRRGDTRPIYIVPVTINYPLVLEAESLIDDYLKAEGQARYIIDDDEFSRFSRVSQFAVKLMGMNTSMIIRYGQPLDVFGNRVAADGTSRGPDGTVIDPMTYLQRDGHAVADSARDAEYTRQLGRAVGNAFLRETVILPTQLMGWVLFERERQRGGPGLDLFTLLRTTSDQPHDWDELCATTDRVRARLVEMEKAAQVRLDDTVRSAPIDSLVAEAVETFGMYHRKAAVRRTASGVKVCDPKLLFYYGNRLSAWSEALREELS